MRDWTEWALGFLGAVVFIGFVLTIAAIIISIKNSFGEFGYKTFSGEEGHSNYCYVSHGGAFCSKEDGYIQVESYWRGK